MKRIFFSALLGIVVFASCTINSGDTHSNGVARIYVDESFKPIFDTSIDTFESQNPKSDIQAVYLPENDVIKAFFADKTKTICVTRDFTEAEKAMLRKDQIVVESDTIAMDAATLIVNEKNIDTLFTVKRIKDILQGKEVFWKNSKDTINVVFDQVNSANFNYLTKLAEIKKLPVNVYAVNSNEEVINYVKSHVKALGIIGVNWVSDADDKKVADFVKGIHIVSVAKDENSSYLKPYSGYVYTKEYPLYRYVIMINKGRRLGINTGFVLFMIGEKGQLIITKSGMAPAASPIRMIDIK